MKDNEVDISDRSFTPKKARFLADQLEEAIRTMRNWGIRIPGNARLPTIVRVLREIAPRDTFPESRSELIRIAHAVRDAQEFTEIGWVLPEGRLEPVYKSLQKAVFGVLGQTRSPAYQSQSELWVGAALVRSGASVGVVNNPQGKHPDFVLRRGRELFPVEVKRPNTMNHAQDLVSGAARQLLSPRRKYDGGALVVDLTDCLGLEDRRDAASAIRLGTGPPDLNSFQAEVRKLTNILHNKVFDASSEQMRERRRHIFGVTTFVRMTWWDFSDLSQIHPYRFVLPVSYLGRLSEVRRRSRARWLAGLIDRGVGETGHQDLGKREVTLH